MSCVVAKYRYKKYSIYWRTLGSLVPRPFEEEEKGPGTHCLRMRHVLRKTHRKITRKFTAYTWIKILTSEAE